MLVMLRFEVAQAELEAFLIHLQAALSVLAQRPGYVEGSIGRATDQPDLVLLETRWRDVGSYRRALGNYDVKVEVVPLLSRAINEPSAYEVLHTRDEHGVHEDPSSLAADAGWVRLGEAAGPGR
ncbi:MAG: antibiotic biosynthesis monooxygenase family protein [Candidatus Nanopelagicales bacterium]